VNLPALIERFRGARLLVVGEVGIDEYVWGDTRRISPEAPVPVVEVESQETKLGLAANVAQNIASLGGRVSLVTVCGRDEEGKRLAGLLDQAGIADRVLLEDASRPTLRKVRILAQKQHLLRVDYERVHGLAPELAGRLLAAVEERLGQADGVILQDYGKGLFNPDTMAIVAKARALGKPVFVDPSRSSPLGLYRGVTLLTPNVAEAEILCGLPPESGRTAGMNLPRLESMARRMLETTSAEHAIITCGPHGMVALSRQGGALTRIPTFAREVFDVTGAGDTVIAVLSLTYCLGEPLGTCMQVANAAAGIVVGRIGAACVSPAELGEALETTPEGAIFC